MLKSQLPTGSSSSFLNFFSLDTAGGLPSLLSFSQGLISSVLTYVLHTSFSPGFTPDTTWYPDTSIVEADRINPATPTFLNRTDSIHTSRLFKACSKHAAQDYK